MEKDKILYIDDEQPNLVTFSAVFRRKYKVLTALTLQRGREQLEENPEIKVIISDQNMREGTGVDFFYSIKNTHPDIIRIILTGFSDQQAMYDGINKANVYRFLTKPWNEIDIAKTIESGIELYNNRHAIGVQNAELEKAYNELSRFVYSASHELRAPLVSVLGLVEIAKHDDATKDNQYLPLIEKSILKLDSFVRNIVNYYQNKEIENTAVQIDVEAMINEAVESILFHQDLPGIDIQIKVDLAKDFHNDKTRFQMVLNNLISNGIKYQREDEANKILSIEVSETSEGINLIVSDNGIGVEKEDQENLFDMFYRATSQNTGSGIGLYIVREAMAKLEGKISVESEFGSGTTFTAAIPNRN
jgi:two-component system, sensor histidine kinase and response regulator